MDFRLLEIRCETPNRDTVESYLREAGPYEWWELSGGGRHTCYRVLLQKSRLQDFLDKAENLVQHLPGLQVLVQPLEALYPTPKRKLDEDAVSFFGGLSREELADEVSGGTRLNLNFLVMLVLSAIVAGIGLHNGDLAVVIGAMVIAPLLEPHIAFALGAALGDFSQMRRATVVNLVSVVVVLALSFLLGMFWPTTGDEYNSVLLARTRLDYSNLALAFAAGAAAVLSLTTGVSSGLVGVMVAVALLPPLAASGLMAGMGDYALALDAFLLALANIVCINLASKLVFQLKGVRPGKWYEQEKSRRALIFSYGLWAAMLAAIVVIITLNEGVKQ